MNRFFLPKVQWNEPAPALSESESHHALDVLRLGEGDKLTVFDGEGHEAPAKITGIEKKIAHLSLGNRTTSPQLPGRITLAQAIPKGKTMDLIVQKAVELGAAAIVPLLSDRTIVRLEEDEKSRKQSKWQDIALEACKQCGQNYLPAVMEPQTVAAFVPRLSKTGLTLIGSLQPDARPIKKVLENFAEDHGRKPSEVTIFIGPEGDFTPAELGLAKSNGALPVTLGPIVLRTETAALYCLSVLAHELYS